MACPTCDHTMHNVDADRRYYWCPRCGTLSSCVPGGWAEAPKLVERVRCNIVECVFTPMERAIKQGEAPG